MPWPTIYHDMLLQLILEESMNAEIDKQCPKVATKKNNSHIWAPTKKHNAHVLQRRMQAVCMQGVETGGVVMETGQ